MLYIAYVIKIKIDANICLHALNTRKKDIPYFLVINRRIISLYQTKKSPTTNIANTKCALIVPREGKGKEEKSDTVG